MGPNQREAARPLWRGGFTLVEMLVATAVLTLIMVFILSITEQTSQVWKHSTGEIQAFQGARSAYDTMTMRLSQATLNTCLDYYDSSYNVRTPADAATFVPYYYARNSNLHFVVDQASKLVPLDTSSTPPTTASCYPGQAVFFQAPLGFTQASPTFGGLSNMLNACGYYVEFNTDLSSFPPFLTSAPSVHQRYRYRLMEFLQPTENNGIYSTPSTGTPSEYDEWFTNFLPPNLTRSIAPLRILAENIVVLILLPELSPQSDVGVLAPNYTYDSRAGNIVTPATNNPHNQLPPLVRVVMVAIDESSAQRLNPDGSTTPPAFLSTLFQGSSLFQISSNLDPDLDTLEAALSAHKVNYRVFDSDVAIRGAKWSTQ